MGLSDRFRQFGKMVRPPKGPGRYEFEPVSWKVSRRLKGVQGPAEDRAGILGFIESHTGVEAYVEPKTVMHPLSVVLVAEAAVGVLFSAWLTYLELGVIHAICIWCVTSAVIVTLMLVVSLADLRDFRVTDGGLGA